MLRRVGLVLAALSLAGAVLVFLGASGPSAALLARANAVPDHAARIRGPIVRPNADVARFLEQHYSGGTPEAGYCATVIVEGVFQDTTLLVTHVDAASSRTSTIAGKPGVEFECTTKWTLHTHPLGACFVSLSDIVEANREHRDGAIVQCGPRDFRAWVVR